MKGIEDANFPAFDRAKKYLEGLGYDVISPADISREFDSMGQDSLELRAKADIDAIFGCRALYMLPGWEKSLGARAEHAIAVWLGITIFYDYTI